MGKRSDFERVKGDFYVTPYEAVIPLLPHIENVKTFVEPCAGNGALIYHLQRHYPLVCSYACDVDPVNEQSDHAYFIDTKDALTLVRCEGNVFITNPPWTRQILHPLINHLSNIAPTWLLFDADWMHTAQAAPYLSRCVKIVSVGRVKWIADSKNTGKDNAAWYLFWGLHSDGPRFYGRNKVDKAAKVD